jgi:stage V sporulation protein S
MDTISVFDDSHTLGIAGIIAGIIREHRRAEIQAIGSEAVTRAVNALGLATGYLMADDILVTCVPEFSKVLIEDREKTAIKIVVDQFYPR